MIYPQVLQSSHIRPNQETQAQALKKRTEVQGRNYTHYHHDETTFGNCWLLSLLCEAERDTYKPILSGLDEYWAVKGQVVRKKLNPNNYKSYQQPENATGKLHVGHTSHLIVSDLDLIQLQGTMTFATTNILGKGFYRRGHSATRLIN